MGTYFNPGQTRAALIRELTATQVFKTTDKGVCTRVTLAKKLNGNVLFSLVELQFTEASPVRFIHIDLLVRSRKDWGYKPMGEDMHPYYYGCPDSFVERADPPATEAAKAWREKNAEYNRLRKEYATVGTEVKVDQGSSVNTFRRVSRSDWGYVRPDGSVTNGGYKIGFVTFYHYRKKYG